MILALKFIPIQISFYESKRAVACYDGDRRDNLYYQRRVRDNYAIFIPAGTWHNLINMAINQ